MSSDERRHRRRAPTRRADGGRRLRQQRADPGEARRHDRQQHEGRHRRGCGRRARAAAVNTPSDERRPVRGPPGEQRRWPPPAGGRTPAGSMLSNVGARHSITFWSTSCRWSSSSGNSSTRGPSGPTAPSSIPSDGPAERTQLDRRRVRRRGGDRRRRRPGARGRAGTTRGCSPRPTRSGSSHRGSSRPSMASAVEREARRARP